MRIFSLSTWIIAASLLGVAVSGVNAAGKVTFADIELGTGNKAKAVKRFLSGSTRVFWEKGKRVSVYYFTPKGRLVRALSGDGNLAYGTWTVSGNKKPKVCVSFSGRTARGKTCYGLNSSAVKYEAAACEGNAFRMSRNSSIAPTAIGQNRNAKRLIRSCSGLSRKRMKDVRAIAGIGPNRHATRDEVGRAKKRAVDLLYRDTTIVSKDSGHGIQVEYHSAKGRAYLAYPSNTRMLPGRWSSQYGGNICYNYGPNTYNPVTGSTRATNCSPVSFRGWPQRTYYCDGDIFGLARSKSNPFGPGKEQARRKARRTCTSVRHPVKLKAIETLKLF